MARGKKKEKELTPEGKLQQALVPIDEQPYKIPENWCWAKFSSLSELISGRDVALSECNSDGEGIPYILGASNIDENTFTVERWITTPVVVSKKGDILLSVKGTIGKLYIQKEELINISRQIMSIRPNHSIINSYIYYFLLYICDKLRLSGNGLIPGISRKDILEQTVPLPPLPEQQRIVDRIESLFAKLDEAKEKAQAVVDGFEDRKAAILHKAFTGELTKEWRKENSISFAEWKVTVVGEISEVKGGKRVPKGMALTDTDTGHPYIKAGNLKHGTVIDKDISYVPEDVLPLIKNYTVKAGDVYITNVGACIGDCGVIPTRFDGANFTENAVKMTNLQCISEYLAWYLSSNSVQSFIKTLIASATLGKLSIANIKTIPILLPSDKEQRKIIELVKSILGKELDAKESAEQVVARIDTLKKSILAHAFRGELGTNNPGDESAEILLETIL